MKGMGGIGMVWIDVVSFLPLTVPSTLATNLLSFLKQACFVHGRTS